MIEQGVPARCWECDRTRWSDTAREAIEVHRLLELGMSWDLALTTLGWTGTRDELHALARCVELIRAERDTPETTHG